MKNKNIRNTTVGGIITKEIDGEEYVLLTKRSDKVEKYKNCWCLPGGFIDENETAEEAIIREVEEETGLIFICNFLSGFDEIIPEKDIDATVLIFVGNGFGELKLNAEVSEIKWFKLTEALKLELAFKHHDILVYYLSNKPKEKKSFLTEYKQLRNEILKLIEIRVRYLYFAIVIFSSFLGFMKLSEGEFYYNLILFYPILAVFLVAFWTHSDLRIHELGTYIRVNIEPKFNGLNWEKYIITVKGEKGQQRNLIEQATIGFFIITEIIAMFIIPIINEFNISQPDWINLEFCILFFLDIIALYFTCRLIRLRRQKYKKINKQRLAKAPTTWPI